MTKEMYLVQYNIGAYSDYSEVNLFVTESEELAKNFVEEAERQFKIADKITRPTWTMQEPIVFGGTRDVMSELKAWEKSRRELIPICPEVAAYDHDKPSFGYFPIEVK